MSLLLTLPKRCRQRSRIQELGEDRNRIGVSPDAGEPLTHRIRGCASIAVEEDVKAAGEIQRVVNLPGGFLAGRAVLELERGLSASTLSEVVTAFGISNAVLANAEALNAVAATVSV
ncbi:hypothetical protein IE4872_PD02184 (plasmid) [Rhizobium gallicum]|uniref:Uncharacterized protein n=1 Tax=Rhizobium gallicum TaxID=56730 RepID=A0A1L5NXX5_9HYPH|nr:hypothetical protein IE4872_PD02184 [Rhizobium gallicum]